MRGKDRKRKNGRNAGKSWLVQRREKGQQVLQLLGKSYPDAKCALDFSTPEELLVATILSAQCTDSMVNSVTPELFRRFPVPDGLAKGKLNEIQAIIRPCGYFRQKSKYIKGTCGKIATEHSGSVPRTMEDLTHLPGVARKTANVVLSVAFDINEGIAVDTHVARLSRRLGLAGSSDPVKVERELMRVVDRSNWGDLTTLLIAHGREVCSARKPQCSACTLSSMCPSAYSF